MNPAYLNPGVYADSDHPAIREFVYKHVDRPDEKKDALIQLYYAVRDGWRYDPYQLDLSEQGLKASSLLNRDFGYCVEKSNLFVTAARVLNIPSRIGFANVRNHMGVEKYRDLTGSDVLAYHGYAEVYLNDRWIKATPVFNKGLCEKLDIDPLEFDGESDSIFQSYSRSGGLFMEYLEDHGTFADIPRNQMLMGIKKYYPKLHDPEYTSKNGFQVNF
jgi:hypothetical protein